jgi:hypothetical protein
MVDYKKHIDYLLDEHVSKEDSIAYLKAQSDLNNEDRLLIYSYCYPRHLLDRELPKHIQHFRSTQGNNGMGWLKPNYREASILVEAYRGIQYGRFMRHLMHSFLEDPEKLGSCSGEGEDNCPLCGKKVYYVGSWNESTDPEAETLAIISSDSSVCLCKDCMVQLAESFNMIEKIEGKGFLNSFRYEKRR